MRKKLYGVTFVSICSVLSLLLISCATTNIKSEKNLDDIITQYWSLRLANKYEETYKYESKNGLLTYNDYVQRASLIKRFEIKSFSILSIKEENGKFLADIEFVTIMPPVTKPFKNLIKDEWIMEDGNWRHVFR